MTNHVHVRVRQDMAVSEDGDLIEHSRCRCGEAWIKTYRIEDAEPE
ncbi:hypothetical protein [Streptomyces sp. GC420]|nr:hypothetical protein [Streptomyces sp. GC420]